MAAALLGIGDFCGGDGGRRIDHPGAVVSIAWVASCVGAAVAGLFVLVFPPAHFGRTDFYWTMVALVFAASARPLLYLSMERGPMAVVAPVFSLVSLVIPAVAGPLLGDALGGAELVGVLLAVPAVALISSEGRLPTAKMLRSGSGVAMGCLVGTLLGCLSLTFAQITPDAGAMPAFLTQLGAVALIPLMTKPFRLMAKLSSEVNRFGLLVGLIDIGAVISMVIAFQRGNVAVVAAMLGFAPVTSMLLAWRIYNESVRRWQWLGAAMGVTAFILFSTAA
jgi:uncharacterized membrane protein